MRRFKVKVNDEVFEVEVEEIGKGEAVRSVRTVSSTPVEPFSLPAPAPRAVPVVPVAPSPVQKTVTSREQQAPESGDGEVVKAPIPGVVSEIKVSAGGDVQKGDVLLLLEAMKMQNEILAPYDARVLEVRVSQGASVQTGDVLVKLQH